MEWTRGNFTVTCDKSRLDRGVILDFLASSYWAAGVPAAVIDQAIDGSLCFGLLDGDRQVGFARAISDRATLAYLADVFVLEDYRGKGLGRWLVECVLSHPELQGLRRWMLGTRDAHGLYRKLGFTPLKKPEIFMELHDPDVYTRR